MQSWVWAIDENGRPCKCFARPENRGKGSCKHQFHQEPGQSVTEFLQSCGAEMPILEAEEVETLPYRMTDEEKEKLLKINCKKDFFEKCDEGAYLHLDSPVWNDMDKNYFSKKVGMSVKDINAVLYEKGFIDENGKFTQKKTSDECVTGVEAMNEFAAKHGFTATQDVYVLPYYMRIGSPDGNGGEIPSDETARYLALFNAKAYGPKSRQVKYEELVNGGAGIPGYKAKYNAHKPLSDRLHGKDRGIWRRDVTGSTIPYAGRAVAVPDVDVAYDEAKIPPCVCVDIFRPTIVSGLQKQGFTPEQISEVIYSAKHKQDKVPKLTRDILQRTLDEGNVRIALNRQPSLHDASMQSFYVKISDSPAVHVNPLCAGGFNLDHDGDTMSIIGFNNPDIVEKVDKELHPSNYKYTPKKQDELNMKPTKDALFGIMSVLKSRTD